MMELPKRKNQRLKNYDYSSKGVYFVTICTKEKRKLLSEIKDATVNLTTVGNVVEKYVKTIPGVEKYVIMPNHVHILVGCGDGQTLSQKIKSFKTMVTKETGATIFQRSFYDHIIRNQQDYDEKSNYIENNPAKWTEDEMY